MTEQYSQSVEVAVSGKLKAMQWCGIASLLLSVGFAVTAGFVSLYMLFGFGLFLLIAIFDLHFYNAEAKEYIYSFNPTRLVVAKKDIVNRTRRVMSVLFEDVTSFAPLEGMSDDGDIICCGNVSDIGVHELNFKAGDEVCRLLFAPDEYMSELIKNRLAKAVDDEEMKENEG